MAKLKNCLTSLVVSTFFISCSPNFANVRDDKIFTKCDELHQNNMYLVAALETCEEAASRGDYDANRKLGDTYLELEREKERFTYFSSRNSSHYIEIRRLLESSRINYKTYLSRFENGNVRTSLADVNALILLNEIEMRNRTNIHYRVKNI